MWLVFAALLMAVAVLAYTMLLNASPVRCPGCRRVNLFRRTKTGRRHDQSDAEGEMRRSAVEVLCGRCGLKYWLVWDDFEGRSARVVPGPDKNLRQKTMRNVIFGGIGVLWGGGILVRWLLIPHADGAYGVGQNIGTGFGLLMLVVGLYYLVTGIRNLSQNEPERKPRKRKRRAVEDDDE